MGADPQPPAASGHEASLRIAADEATVWRCLHQITTRDCPLTAALVLIRSAPALVLGRGALHDDRAASLRTSLLEEMTSGRFAVLRSDPPESLVLGIIGQFWKLGGGTDATFDGLAGFVGFDRPGYVKTTLSFDIETTVDGSRLTTATRNWPTDEAAARHLARYWCLVGFASKLTRIEMLHAIRRRAVRDAYDR